ncbi:MAG: hypothetical protein LBG52_07835 [Candidatus Peribacteria bacterium]|nr:hypothetical protein [Candidatus Peribacteria bacterium]
MTRCTSVGTAFTYDRHHAVAGGERKKEHQLNSQKKTDWRRSYDQS